MMHMTMYWGPDLTLLFDWWTTDSWPSYSLTLVACFLFSLLYQYMEYLRLRFKFTSAISADRPFQPSSIETPLLSKRSRTQRLYNAVLFGINSAIGYVLMLSVMSYNGGVFLSVVLGISVGYYSFRCGDLENDAVVVENSCACS